MALNKTALLNLSNSSFPSGTGSISAAQLRQFNQQLVESMTNNQDTAEQSLLSDLNVNNKLLKNVNNAIQKEQVLEAVAALTAQNPSGLNQVLKVNFGPAQGTGSDLVQISGSGDLTVNRTAYLEFEVLLSFGRTGSGGVSHVTLRGVLNGAQAGRTQAIFLDEFANREVRTFNASGLYNAGSTLSIEIYRDSSGHNSGGLLPFTPALGQFAPISPAILRVYRYTMANVSKG